MLIINWPIGLGNQLNLFALYIKLKGMGKEVKMELPDITRKAYYSNADNVRQLDLSLLDVKYDVCTLEERAMYIDDKQDLFSRIRRLFRNRSLIIKEADIDKFGWGGGEDGYLSGVFNVDYTYDVIDAVREQIKFYPSENPLNRKAASDMERNNTCSLHFRRTDYLLPKNQFLNIMTEQYYDSAIKHMRERYKDIIFYVFSDDIEYVKNKFKGQEDIFKIVDWNRDDAGVYDLQLMSLCHHNICANSSFSNWGWLLNRHTDKEVIKPWRKAEKNVVSNYCRDCTLITCEDGKIIQDKGMALK